MCSDINTSTSLHCNQPTAVPLYKDRGCQYVACLRSVSGDKCAWKYGGMMGYTGKPKNHGRETHSIASVQQ